MSSKPIHSVVVFISLSNSIICHSDVTATIPHCYVIRNMPTIEKNYISQLAPELLWLNVHQHHRIFIKEQKV